MRRLLAILPFAIVVAACAPAYQPETITHDDHSLVGLEIAVHESPGCGCCVQWVAYLKELGAEVTTESDPNLVELRRTHGIPDRAASCHTALVDGYAVEGHVPAGAILQLLAERPDAAGLALPGMPGDSPGMGGDVSTWESQRVQLVTPDGDLVPFVY